MRIAMQENIYFWYHPHMWHKTRNMFSIFWTNRGIGNSRSPIPTHLQVLLLQLVVDYFQEKYIIPSCISPVKYFNNNFSNIWLRIR